MYTLAQVKSHSTYFCLVELKLWTRDIHDLQLSWKCRIPTRLPHLPNSTCNHLLHRLWPLELLKDHQNTAHYRSLLCSLLHNHNSDKAYIAQWDGKLVPYNCGQPGLGILLITAVTFKQYNFESISVWLKYEDIIHLERTSIDKTSTRYLTSDLKTNTVK